MRRAVYPQRSCRMPVHGEHQDYSCEVPDLHPGPCASLSDPASVARRDAWERSHQGWEAAPAFVLPAPPR